MSFSSAAPSPPRQSRSSCVMCCCAAVGIVRQLNRNSSERRSGKRGQRGAIGSTQKFFAAVVGFSAGFRFGPVKEFIL